MVYLDILIIKEHSTVCEFVNTRSLAIRFGINLIIKFVALFTMVGHNAPLG